jgi:predicted negative regulator of RcsB-dependent stress response
VATIEDDEESKKRVLEAVWTWTGRIIVLLVVFGGGAFLGWILWGSGNAGAVQLRPRVGELEGQLTEQKKKVIDCEGKLVVVQGRLNEVQRAMQRPTGTP